MPFILRKTNPSGSRTYLTVLPEYGTQIRPESMSYDPNPERATQFSSRQEAEQVQDALRRGSPRPITIVEI
jgi:hypothetical protein